MKQMNTTLSLFLETGRIIRSRMERALPLPFAQCELLRLIAEKNSPTMRDIARYFKVTAPSATSLVDELVRGKYLERSRDRKDRRQIHILLTPKGKAVLKEVTLRRKKVLSGVIEVLSASDRSDLNRILTKIVVAS